MKVLQIRVQFQTMSKIAKASANKKYNVPDFKIVGKTTPDIVKKINQLVVEKKANDVINIIYVFDRENNTINFPNTEMLGFINSC